MEARELSQKYAKAIFGLALEKWTTALSSVQDELAKNGPLVEQLDNTTEPFSARKRSFDKATPGEIDPQVKNFLYTLLKEGHVSALPTILEQLELMIKGGPEVEVARINTAYALSDGEKNQFRQKLRQKYGKNLEFLFEVDPSLVGGVLVQIGDKIIDGTIASRLESMSNLLGVSKS